MDKASGKLPGVIEGVMRALTFSRQEEVKAWEQEFVSCEHIFGLEQQQSATVNSQGTSSLASLDRIEPCY